MKFLFTSRQFYPCVGGTETYMLECAKRLVERGHEVTVVTLNRNLYTGEEMPSQGEHHGIKIVRLPFLKLPLRPLPLYNPLRLLGICRDVDFIHTHDIRFLFEFTLFLKFLLGVPLVIGSYGYILHQKQLAWLKNTVFHLYYRPLFRLASAMHTISKQDEDHIQNLKGKLPIHRVVGGIDFRKFSGLAARNWSQWPRKGEPIQLLYFGRLDRHKGVDLLLPVLEKISSQSGLRFDLHLVFGSFHHEFKALIERMEERLPESIRLKWHGRLAEAELLKQITAADFVVLPSRYEGFGLTTVEAMAAGAIVIGNDIDAFRNIITEGQDGFLAAFTDADANKAVEKLTEVFHLSGDRLAEVSAKAAVTARSYDWDFRVDELMVLYKEVHPKSAAGVSAE